MRYDDGVRKQRFAWTYLVVSILFIIYGGSFTFSQFGKDNGLFTGALVFLILGLLMLALYLVFFFVWKRDQRKKSAQARQEEPEPEEDKREPEPEPESEAETPEPAAPQRATRSDTEYVRTPVRRASSRSYGTAYVREFGSGPVLEINGTRIRDMRDNRYYRIEDEYVYAQGSGLSYEICGNRIRTLSGSYLYEVSGDSINKVFGGFFASVSGNIITKYDGSRRFEVSGSLNTPLLLIIAVLVFGE